MIKIKVELEFTKHQIADLLCSGFEGGIDYWGTFDSKHSIKPKIIDWASFGGKDPRGPDDYAPLAWSNPEHEYKYIHWPLSEGGAACIITEDKLERKRYSLDGTQHVVLAPSKRHLLDMKSIKEGMQIFADKCPHQFSNFRNDDDACTGDCFIQMALFGELVYG